MQIQRIRYTTLSVVVCLLALLGGPSSGAAQTFNATILGTVRDPSQSVLPGVTVTIANEATGFTRTAVTNDQGNYTFVDVPIGSYAVTAQAPSFAKYIATHFTVHVAQAARLDITMQLATTKQEVSVIAAAPLVETDKSAVETAVTRREVLDLPLNGRDYTQLAALTPGAVYLGNNDVSSSVQINGNRSDKTSFLVDGESNTETWYGGALSSPSPDAIQEFQVLASNSSAEFGSGAGTIDVVTKSGTNQFHGDLYEFLRNDAFDARNFFALKKPSLKRNQFGCDLGGPILKDRLFFYTEYGRTSDHEEIPTDVRVPTDAMRRGDFSALSTPIKDPLTGQPFLGNVIPPGRISSIAQYFQQFVPEPNSGTDRLILNTPSPIDRTNFSVRADAHTPKTTIMGRYIYGSFKHQNVNGTQYYGSSNQLGNVVREVRTQNLTLNLTRILTPNMLLDVRGGFYYNWWYNFAPADSGPNRVVESGIGGFDETTAATGHGGFPQIGISTYGGIPGGSFLNLKPQQKVWTLSGSLNWIHGQHNMKFGAGYERQLSDDQNDYIAKGIFTFTGFFTGNAYADYLLGDLNYSLRTPPQPKWGTRTPSWYFYAQDNWNIRPNLTLNIGSRFEFDSMPIPEQAGSNFYPDLGKVVMSARNGKVDYWSPLAPVVVASEPQWFVLSDQVGAPFALTHAVGGHFDPRFGFAWRPFGGTDTVVRGGAGIFTVPFQGNVSRVYATVNPPWQIFQFRFSGVPSDWATFWPSFSGPQGFLAPTVSFADKKFKTAYTSEWNLTIEHKLGASTALAVNYVGNKSTHLSLNDNLQQPPYGPNAFSEVPFPQFSTTLGQHFGAGGNANYNALQIRATKHLSHGLSFLVSYSWSKTMDYTSSDETFIADRFHPRLDYAVSSLDTGHTLVASWVYDLPFGPGKRWLTHGGAAGKIVGGWHFTGIATFASGAPFSVLNPFDTSGYIVQDPGQRADRTCGGRLSNPTVNEWFDTSCFTLATPYTIGNSARNILRSDGTQNFDLGFLKDIHFTETKYLQFRWEMFNAFNHPIFGPPDSTIGTDTSGQVFSAGPAREMQVALKLYF